MKYTSKLDVIKVISIISLFSALIVYVLLPENKNIDNKILSHSVELNNQITTKQRVRVEASTNVSCNDEVTDYHCLEGITEKLASQNTIIKMSGLNLLWRYIDEHYSDINIEKQLQLLKTDDNFKVKDLAIFIANKMEYLRNPELVEKINNTIIDENESGNVYQEMTESSTEANLAESLNEKLNENSNTVLIDDHDENVRMTSIEKIIVERNDDAIDLLSKALSDSESDIRLTAVDGLGQFLTEGFGDPELIVNSLQKSLDDQDTKIVELSQELLTQYNNMKSEQEQSIEIQ